MNRLTRKELKTDPFAKEVTNVFEYISGHRKESIRYGALALAVIAVAAGIYFYMRHQTTARETALERALNIDLASVGPSPVPGSLNFKTQAEKDTARAKAFLDVSAKYRGSQEGAMAALYLASDAADKGDLADAEKRYRDIVNSAPAAYASMARLALAQVYAGEGKQADAEKTLREAIASPTVTVSKEEATIALAELLIKTNPTEAKKLVEPLRTSRSTVSRVAVQVLGEIAANTNAQNTK